MSLRVILCTAPEKDVKGIARTLVEERLVACVNMLPVQSVYRWEGKIVEDGEVLMIMKTTAERVPALLERIPRLHPYTVPEIVEVPTERVFEKYLVWAVTETRA